MHLSDENMVIPHTHVKKIIIPHTRHVFMVFHTSHVLKGKKPWGTNCVCRVLWKDGLSVGTIWTLSIIYDVKGHCARVVSARYIISRNCEADPSKIHSDCHRPLGQHFRDHLYLYIVALLGDSRTSPPMYTGSPEDETGSPEIRNSPTSNQRTKPGSYGKACVIPHLNPPSHFFLRGTMLILWLGHLSKEYLPYALDFTITN